MVIVLYMYVKLSQVTHAHTDWPIARCNVGVRMRYTITSYDVMISKSCCSGFVYCVEL